MRLSLHIIGLTTALLLGVVNVDARHDLCNQEDSSSVHLMEEVATLSVKAKADVTSSTETTESKTPVTTEEVKPSNHTEELKANLHAVGTALKDGVLATAQALNGVIALVDPVVNIAIGTAKLSISLAKFVWFGGKLLYSTGMVVAEGVQAAHAYLTK